jgi:hypothetical protein
VKVKHVTQQNPRRSTHSPKLVSTSFNEVFDSKPTPTYNKINRPHSSKVILQAKLSKDTGQLKLASSNSPSPALVVHQMADLVTEMKLIKHPYDDQGIPAQKGIEF